MRMERFRSQWGGLITYNLIQYSSKAGTALSQLPATILIGLYPLYTSLSKYIYYICKQVDGLLKIVINNRHHDIKFELSCLCRKCNSSIIADNLKSHHVKHLCHYRVYLARHNRRTGLNCRQAYLSPTSPRTSA